MNKTSDAIYDDFRSFLNNRLEINHLAGDDDRLSLSELILQLRVLQNLLRDDGRDPNCVNVKFNNRIIRSIDIEDDGSSQDMMDVVLK